VLAGWSKLVIDLPDEAMTIAVLRTAPADPPFPSALHGRPVLVLSTMWVGDLADGEAGLAPLRTIGHPTVDAVEPRG
jgi:hypothetical protein